MISKLNTFWYVFTKTISEPRYYNHVVDAPLRYSFRYFLVFFLLLSLANTAVFYLRVQPELINLVSNTTQDLNQYFPKNLVLQFGPDQLTTAGSTLPLIIPFSPTLNTFLNEDGSYKHLLVIDPESTTASQSALLTLTRNEVVFTSSTQLQEKLPYNVLTTETITIDRATIVAVIDQLKPRLLQWLQWIPLLFLCVTLIFATLSTLLLLAVYSLFTYTLSGLLGKKLTYAKSFQIGLHTITFAETAGLFYTLFFPDKDFSLLYSLAFFGATAMAVYSLKQTLKPETDNVAR